MVPIYLLHTSTVPKIEKCARASVAESLEDKLVKTNEIDSYLGASMTWSHPIGEVKGRTS